MQETENRPGEPEQSFTGVSGKRRDETVESLEWWPRDLYSTLAVG